MKTLFIIFIIVFLFGCNSLPIEKQKILARESVVVAQMCKDMQQTINISKNSNYHEINPLIGKHPSTRKVKNYFLLRTIVHGVVSINLNEKQSRIWQVGFLLGSSFLTQHNNSIGLESDSNIEWYTEYSWNF